MGYVGIVDGGDCPPSLSSDPNVEGLSSTSEHPASHDVSSSEAQEAVLVPVPRRRELVQHGGRDPLASPQEAQGKSRQGCPGSLS